jgi:hypothetical protein
MERVSSLERRTVSQQQAAARHQLAVKSVAVCATLLLPKKNCLRIVVFNAAGIPVR